MPGQCTAQPLLVAGLAMAWGSAPALAQGPAPLPFRVVASTGGAAPGVPGATFASLDTRPSINQAGLVLFTGSTNTSSFSLWVETMPGSAVRVISRGDPVPGQPGLTFMSIGLSKVHNVHNLIAFNGTMAGPGVMFFFNDGCVVAGPPGNQQLIVRGAQDRPAGSRPGVFGSLTFSQVAMNDAGAIVFDDGLNTGGEYGLWRAQWGVPGGVASSLAPIALAGDLVCGGGGARYFDLFSFGGLNARVNALGQTIFEGPLVGTGVTNENGDSLVYGPVTGPCLTIRAGSPAPGVPGASFAAFDVGPLINDAGEVAFSGYTVNPVRNCIWSGPVTSPLLIASDDPASPAPGGGGARFTDLGAPFLSDVGRVAFTSELTGAGVNTLNNTGIWSNSTGVLRMLAREGSPAPGASGALFDDLELNFPCINTRGEVAFTARLRSPDGMFLQEGVWAADRTGTLLPIAVPGMTIDINPDPNVTVLRTVTSASTEAGSGGHDGRPTSLNDRGELVVLVTYTGGSFGSGIFVYTLPGCTADFNGDGTATLQDLFDYLGAYFAGSSSADIDGSGSVTLQDLFDFIGAWFAGCG